MPIAEAQKNKLNPVRRRVPINADANGDVATHIEIVRAGTWPEMSNKGMLFITPDDLSQMVANFNAGIGCAGGLNQIPVDFSHNDGGEAAGWITALSTDGQAVYADVEWSTSGLAAIQGKMFKFVSPSFYPGCLGEWSDPEDWSITASNVLVGLALTNIPFFKDLQPVTASRDSQEGEVKNTLFVDASAKGATMPTLDEVRVKDASALTDEDKTLLAEHKAELSADEIQKFNLAEAPAEVEEEETVAETPEVKEALAVQASIKSGNKILVDADAHKALEGKVEAMNKQLTAARKEKVEASVDAAIDQGKIIADQKDNWVKRVMADETMLEVLEALPKNKVVADITGADDATATGASSYAKLKDEATKISADRGISWSQGMVAARKENQTLAAEADDELKAN